MSIVKKILGMLSIAFALMFVTNNLMAEDPPCTLPCDGGTWIHVVDAPFSDNANCSGCTFYLTYDIKTSICNNITYTNVYLKKVTYSSACTNCYSSIPDLLFAGNSLLLQEIKSGFTSGSQNLVTFLQLKCWKYVGPNGDELEPCQGPNDCCVNSALYEYNDSSLEWELIESYSNVPSTECYYGCIPTCEEEWFEKASIDNQFIFTELDIIPNPAKEYIDVSFSSDYNGRIELSIYDMSGNLILTNKFNKSMQNFDEKLDVNSLVPGVYLLKTNLENGVIINSSTFVVE